MAGAALLLVSGLGCYSFEPISMLNGKPADSTPHAMVMDADGVRCTKINGQAIKEKLRITPGKGDSAERYLVPAGPCELVVEYSNNTGTIVTFSDTKTLKFTAVPGKTYKLNSYIASGLHGSRLTNDQWDARLHDESEKDAKIFVVQTTDVKKKS
jgi:hypothetical protein